MRKAKADDQQSIRKQSPATITNEWNPTCSPWTHNGCLRVSSSNRVVATDCHGYNLCSEGASRNRRYEPSSGGKAKTTGKARARRGTAALAQRRL
jgi:hypothetical protein